jgi:tRNA1Val (adenine37-N6)-methyltransferase
MTADAAAQGARDYFPRGLDQPCPGYRFSLDSLLVASFARGAGPRVLDLGCGCGVIGLAMLLDDPGLEVTGLDIESDMITCARSNAEKLGFNKNFTAIQGDVREVRKSRPFEPEVFDAGVCNPPYRDPGSGRTPQGGRLAARFEERAGIEDFVRAAAFGLKNKGRFFVVFLPERLAALFAAMNQYGLEPKRIMPVYGKAGEPAKIILVEARKNGGPGLAVEPGLVLYEGGKLTGAALEFCPRLGCNTGDG